MSEHSVQWPFAILLALGLAAVCGVVNGFCIGYLGASSFIITLAASTVLTGLEYLLTGQRTLIDNIPSGFLNVYGYRLFGLSFEVWIAIGISLVAYLLMRHTEFGRYMYAIGGNREAARLSGVPVERIRLIGFVLAAIAAAVAGILLASQDASSIPNAGASYLLPAFTAAFLGTAAFTPGQFNMPGTLLGVLFLDVLQAALNMFNLSAAAINIVQGTILAVAILVSREARRR
jgi:ribose transport system permease protein